MTLQEEADKLTPIIHSQLNTIISLKQLTNCREYSIAITKIEECIHRLRDRVSYLRSEIAVNRTDNQE